MALGGWSTTSTIKRHYVEESYLLPPEASEFYAWLGQGDPISVASTQMRLGDAVAAPPPDLKRQASDTPAAPAKRARKKKSLTSL